MPTDPLKIFRDSRTLKVISNTFPSMSKQRFCTNVHSVYCISQVDPYDYDTILFILKLVKELSQQETSATVNKVMTVLAVPLLNYVDEIFHRHHVCQHHCVASFRQCSGAIISKGYCKDV